MAYILGTLKWEHPNMTDYFGVYGKFLGHAMAINSPNQNEIVDYTGNPGSVNSMYYSFCFFMGDDGYKVEKRSETIEVNPVHQQYYQITQAQKDALETRIREGLARISQSVADFELVLHDIRRYEEYTDYIKLSESKDEKERRDGELSLRTIFIDQVDFYAGETAGGNAGRLSMAFMRNNNIMPTIVDDFMRLKDRKDLEKGGPFEKLPEVERRMLETKWILYEEWKAIFKSNIKQRLERLKILEKSRKRTIDEYRDWLKPTIARFKLLEDALSSPSERQKLRTHFIRAAGTATSLNMMVLWCWKAFPVFEERPTPTELLAQDMKFDALDEWTKRELVFHKHNGLIQKYPWLTLEWVKKERKKIFDKVEGFGWLDTSRLYWSFFEIPLLKVNLRMASGKELENGIFTVSNWMMSQNVIFVKLLELRAEQEDFENYVNSLLGLEERGTPSIVKNHRKVEGYIREGFRFGIIDSFDEAKDKWNVREWIKSKKEMLKKYPEDKFYLVRHDNPSVAKKYAVEILGLDMMFTKTAGPYERTFKDRLNKFFLKPKGKRFAKIVRKIKSLMKVGEPA